MSANGFNLEEEYGGLLDLLETYISEISDRSIQHFGVKGMHWGIRKEKDTAKSTESKAARKEARKNFREFHGKVFDKRMLAPELDKKAYDNFSTKEFTLKKGTTVRRVTQRKNEQLRSTTYVSFKKSDGDIYRAAMTARLFGGGRKNYKNSYEATYKTLETLRSPSEKERFDAFVNLFDTPSIKLKNGKTVTGREYLKDGVYSNEVKTLDSQRLGLAIYRNFTQNQFSETALNTAYFKSLRDKGYNAIVDDNDRGFVSDTPLIVLNPNGTLKTMSVKALSADDINAAQRRLSSLA